MDARLLGRGLRTTRCIKRVRCQCTTGGNDGINVAELFGALQTSRLSTASSWRAKSKKLPAAAASGKGGNNGGHRPLKYSPPNRTIPRGATTTTSPPPPSTISNSLRFRKIPLLLVGITAFCISSYSAYLYVSYKRAVSEGKLSNVPADTSERYDVIAPTFDASVDWTERLMDLNKLRKKMISQASGDVCEVSIGTGRNLTFYDWNFKGVNGVGRVGTDYKVKGGKVKSFTAVDKSAEMLEVAHEKFSKKYAGILGVRWVVQDALQPLPPPPQTAGGGNTGNGKKMDKKYDTIVQTMGLCSTGDPIGLLKNLGASVEPEGGRILLLEHGRGTWEWVNNILDGLAARHAAEFGCWWNRDIGKIVEESGLEVVKIERRHAGTTWWIELKPKGGS